jgi:radical SAM protein with 4Fe4S-binding SPASM domain
MELTEACNLRCRFCYNSLEPRYIEEGKAIALLDALAAQGVMEVVLTGGEPTLHPAFVTIAERAGAKFAHAMLQTNGTLLTERTLSALVSSGFVGLNVSLHGPPDVHDQLTTVAGSYEAAAASIDLALDSGVVVWVNTVLTKQNAATLHSHLRALRTRGVRSFTFTRCTETGSGRDTGLALTGDEVVAAVRCIDEFAGENPGCSVLMANAVPRCALPSELWDYCESCSYGTSRFYVNVRGELMVCGMSRVVLGNLFSQSLQEMKRGSRAFEQICTGTALPQSCANCEEVASCRGGCRAAALAVTGSLCGADPLCLGPKHGGMEVDERV